MLRFIAWERNQRLERRFPQQWNSSKSQWKASSWLDPSGIFRILEVPGSSKVGINMQVNGKVVLSQAWGWFFHPSWTWGSDQFVWLQYNRNSNLYRASPSATIILESKLQLQSRTSAIPIRILLSNTVTWHQLKLCWICHLPPNLMLAATVLMVFGKQLCCVSSCTFGLV